MSSSHCFLHVESLAETLNEPFFVSLTKKLLSISISWDDWLRLEQYISCKRKRFLSPFTKLLNLRLRKENISCNLISNNNYFTTAQKIEPKHYWRGYYKCKNCKSTYIAIINTISMKKEVVIDVSIENECNKCKEETIKIRSTGAGRKDLAKDLMIKGTLNVKSNNIIFNAENQENINSKLCLN